MENNKFNNWYSSILETVKTAEPTATVKTEPAGKSGVESSASVSSVSREEIISDVDTIMTNLSQLASQVSEDLQIIEEMILEAGAGEKATDKVKDFLFAPKYRGMQKKVNKMKMNALDMQITVDNLSGAKDSPEAAKKDAIKSKKTTMDQQIKDLQTAIDDKAKDRGSYVQKVLKSEKIKGQMELVKRASGQEDDPKKKKDLAASMVELQKRYEEEQAAAAALKDKAKEAPNTEAPNTEAPNTEAPNTEAPNTEAPNADDAPEKPDNTEKIAALDTKIDGLKKDKKTKEDQLNSKNHPDVLAAETAIKSAELEKAKLEDNPESVASAENALKTAKDDQKAAVKDADGADNETKADREKKNSKDGMLDRYKELLKKAEDSGDEEKIKKIKDKIATISAKESWQLEGTELGRIFEAELKLLESQYALNESRYTNISVADKFRQLLG